MERLAAVSPLPRRPFVSGRLVVLTLLGICVVGTAVMTGYLWSLRGRTFQTGFAVRAGASEAEIEEQFGAPGATFATTSELRGFAVRTNHAFRSRSLVGRCGGFATEASSHVYLREPHLPDVQGKALWYPGRKGAGTLLYLDADARLTCALWATL